MKYTVNDINNIQNYLPTFRDTACCLGRYICTVVHEPVIQMQGVIHEIKNTSQCWVSGKYLYKKYQ